MYTRDKALTRFARILYYNQSRAELTQKLKSY